MGLRTSLLGGALLVGTATLPASAATAVLNSFENSLNGYSLVGGQYGDNFYQFDGFSTTTGVTAGKYSAIIDPVPTNTGTGPNYSGLFQSGYSTSLLTTLSTTNTISIDVFAPSNSFTYLQVGAAIQTNDPAFTYTSLGGFDDAHTATLGAETTISFTISPALQATLLADATAGYGVNLSFALGGGYQTGGSNTAYVDNIVATGTFTPEPASLALIGLAAPLLMRRRRA